MHCIRLTLGRTSGITLQPPGRQKPLKLDQTSQYVRLFLTEHPAPLLGSCQSLSFRISIDSPMTTIYRENRSSSPRNFNLLTLIFHIQMSNQTKASVISSEELTVMSLLSSSQVVELRIEETFNEISGETFRM